MESHETYMREALVEAEQGVLEGEVPVGAILVAPADDVLFKPGRISLEVLPHCGAQIVQALHAQSRSGSPSGCVRPNVSRQSRAK